MPLSAVQPEHYSELLVAKSEVVRKLLQVYGPPEPDIFPSSPTGYRMRAEFRVWHSGDAMDYVMFRREDPKTPVVIERFPVASETIQRLMPALRDYVARSGELRRRLFQVEFLSTLAGDTLITLVYHRRLDSAWETEAAALRTSLQGICPELSLIGRSRKQKLVLGRDWVCEALPLGDTTYHYHQYEQSFTQPNAGVNIRMIEWACQCADGLEGDLLELYCGNGNFTLPLSRHFDQVIATELSKKSIRAARENMASNGIDNIHMIRLAAEEVAQAIGRERVFRRLATLSQPLDQYDLRTVFVDPPRAGLDAATVKMVSGFDSVIYISCNHHTLADNLDVLRDTHCVKRFALFDQFPYTDHMECGVLLQRS